MKSTRNLVSEIMFLLSLLGHSSDPWHVYCLRTVSDQVWSFNVCERVHTDVADMREREACRLERAFAESLLKKTTKPAKGRG